jgi:hypothetical protein
MAQITVSGDGLRVAVSNSSKTIYYSIDESTAVVGDNWEENLNPSSDISVFNGLKLTSDGHKLFGVQNDGYVSIAKANVKKSAPTAGIIGLTGSAIELLYDGTNWVPQSSSGNFIVY